MIKLNRALIGAIICVSLLLCADASYCSLPATNNTGSIALPCVGKSVLVLKKLNNGQAGDNVCVRGEQKTLTVPVGEYLVQSCTFSIPAKNDTTWTFTAYGDPNGNDKPIEIKNGKVTKLPFLDDAVSEATTASTGTITLPFNGLSWLHLTKAPITKSLTCYFSLYSSSSTLTVPVGKYSITLCGSSVMDKDGKYWAINSNPADPSGSMTIEVKPGADVKIESYEPLTASIEVKQDGNDKVKMSMQMTGTNGYRCIIQPIGAQKHGFTVLSESGESLMSGSFEYG